MPTEAAINPSDVGKGEHSVGFRPDQFRGAAPTVGDCTISNPGTDLVGDVAAPVRVLELPVRPALVDRLPKQLVRPTCDLGLVVLLRAQPNTARRQLER